MRSRRTAALLSTLAVAALGVLSPRAAAAQSTRQLLDSAKALYEAFQVEAARPIYQQIIAANYNRQLSQLERAEAYKYLAVTAAAMNNQAEAVNYFQSALDFDPFTDLDPTKFADAEQAAFVLAKQKLFKVAMKPLDQTLVQRDTASMFLRLQLITTQRANLTVRLNGPDTVILFNGLVDGPRTQTWNGVAATGDYARPGTYTLRLEGTPTSGAPAPPPQEVILRIEHVYEPLEEPLPALDTLNRRQFLPQRITTWEPYTDVAKGVGLAAVSFAIPLLALDSKQINWGTHAGISAVVGLAAGGISYWYRKSNPEIRSNIAENNVRRAALDRFNAAVAERNAIRRQRTKLIVTPVTGAGQ
jgi:tetratricopeptide (TPR) repeat protein